MTKDNPPLENFSKKISHADDSAGALLKEVLEGTTGRNFDIDSIFVEQLESGGWRWVVYEFLKAETMPPEKSHPNYYWHKNKRKFLSLWAVIKTLRKAGYQADLILLNYAEDRTKKVKEMRVLDIKEQADNIIRKAYTVDGKRHPEIKENVQTTDEKVMLFEEWKQRFRHFNDNKKGETWELLEPSPGQSPQAISLLSKSSSKAASPICEKCGEPFVPRMEGARLCFNCWKITHLT